MEELFFLSKIFGFVFAFTILIVGFVFCVVDVCRYFVMNVKPDYAIIGEKAACGLYCMIGCLIENIEEFLMMSYKRIREWAFLNPLALIYGSELFFIIFLVAHHD